MDGVLIDEMDRRREAKELQNSYDTDFFDVYFDEGLAYEYDTFRRDVISFVKSLSEKYDASVVIVTARPTYFFETQRQIALLRHYGLNIIDVFTKNSIQDSPTYKKQVIDDLISSGYKVIMIIDDREDVLQKVKEAYPKIKIVKIPYNSKKGGKYV